MIDSLKPEEQIASEELIAALVQIDNLTGRDFETRTVVYNGEERDVLYLQNPYDYDFYIFPEDVWELSQKSWEIGKHNPH